MNKRELNLKSTNKLIINLILIIVIAATSGNFTDTLRGQKPLLVSVLFTSLGIGILIYLYNLNKKESALSKLKYHAYIGFFLLYVYTLFTSTRVIVFIYVFPIMYMYILYYDVKIMKKIAASVIVSNFMRIIWLLTVIGANDKATKTDYIVQILAVCVVCWNSVVATRMTKKFNNDNLSEIQEVSENQKVILEEVLEIGNLLDNHSTEMYNIVSNLETSSTIMNDNMDNMDDGINNTISNIDTQIQLTKNIHSTISNTVDTAKELEKISGLTIEKMDKGLEIVKDLNDKKTIMNEAGRLAYSSMINLKEKADEISNITTTITAIANQTNILSLNAAIESARAGEAGKGFSIVAKEVGNLATQTTDSVADISKIISELQKMVQTSVSAIEKLESANLEQNNLIQDTETIFYGTLNNMNKVNEEVNEVSDKINSILYSNNEIVKSINDISESSDIYKEAMTQTTSATNKTLLHINETKKIAEELVNASEKLKKYL